VKEWWRSKECGIEIFANRAKIKMIYEVDKREMRNVYIEAVSGVTSALSRCIGWGILWERRENESPTTPTFSGSLRVPPRLRWAAPTPA